MQVNNENTIHLTDTSRDYNRLLRDVSHDACLAVIKAMQDVCSSVQKGRILSYLFSPRFNRLLNKARRIVDSRKYAVVYLPQNTSRSFKALSPKSKVASVSRLRRYCSMLSSGIIIKSLCFSIEQQSVERVYACWCFLRLVSVLKSMGFCPTTDDVFDVYSDGVCINMHGNKTSSYVFKRAKDKREVTLDFHPYDENAYFTLELSRQSKYAFFPQYYSSSAHLRPDLPDDYINISFFYFQSFINASPISVCFSPSFMKYGDKLIRSLISDTDTSLQNPTANGHSCFGKKDVLVGSLGTQQQLYDNLSKNYYYAPMRNVDRNNLPRYIALYQSSNLFPDDLGIRYYGEVTKTRKVKRKSIRLPVRHSNYNELYYEFRIKEWQTLPHTICVKDEGVYEPKYTNMFLLKNCIDSYQLFNIHSYDEYLLANFLDKLQYPSPHTDSTDTVFTSSCGNTLVYADGSLAVFDARQKPLLDFSITLSDYSMHPKDYFNLLSDKIFTPSHSSGSMDTLTKPFL